MVPIAVRMVIRVWMTTFQMFLLFDVSLIRYPSSFLI